MNSSHENLKDLLKIDVARLRMPNEITKWSKWASGVAGLASGVEHTFYAEKKIGQVWGLPVRLQWNNACDQQGDG
ncbi:hypothetical protein NL676_012304 [Syzygium grande]|nr:hypothetical protein NL676_012304 [Syzygium grande]